MIEKFASYADTTNWENSHDFLYNLAFCACDVAYYQRSSIELDKQLSLMRYKPGLSEPNMAEDPIYDELIELSDDELLTLLVEVDELIENLEE